MDAIPPIVAIFYAEFHPVNGAVVSCQVPEGFLQSTDTRNQDPRKLNFLDFSEYLIPKVQLCNQLLSISSKKYKIMGFPVMINSAKYDRNFYIFNVCLVFESTSKYAERPYDQVVTKIARVLQTLETEKQFLWNSDKKAHLCSVLEQIMDDMNSHHECRIVIDEENTLDLKLFPQLATPTPIQDYQVPILVQTLDKYVDKHWDLTLQRILPFIDGVHHIYKIAQLSKVNLDYVRQAIQHLVYYGCCKLIDIFQFSNIYACNHRFSEFIQSNQLQDQCLQYVSKKGYVIQIGQIIKLYCCLKESINLEQWVQDNLRFVEMIEIRKFIIFGVLSGFLSRVHCYPVSLKVDESLGNKITKYLNGMYHMDSLLVKFQLTFKQLMQALERAEIDLIYK